MDRITLILAILVPAAIVGFAVLLFFVALLERRPTRPYTSTPASEDLPHYKHLIDNAASLVAEGFCPADFARQNAGALKGTFALWLSPDRTTVASLGVTTLAGKPIQRTYFWTQLPDGRYLLTTDNSDPGDFSKMIVAQERVGMPLAKLWELHRKQLCYYPAVPAWPVDVKYDTLNQIQQARAERMAEQGYIRWADSQRTAWKYSVRGAAKAMMNGVRKITDTKNQEKPEQLRTAGAGQRRV